MENPTTPETPNPDIKAAKWYTNKDVIEVAFKIAVALTTSLYIAGYLSWAVFAYHNSLGFLPALREQYIIAGITPVILFAVFTAIALFCRRLSINLWVKLMHNKYGGYLLFVWSAIGMCLYYLFKSSTSNEQLIAFTFLEMIVYSLFNVFFIVLILVPVVSLNYRLIGGGVLNYFVTSFMFLFINYILVRFLFMYAVSYFPSLPREFGGPKAEPYTFDVNRTELSDKTLSMICEDDWVAANNGQNVYSTDTLYLIFDSDEYLLLKKYDRDLGKDNPLIKLKTSCVRAQFPLR